MTPTLWTIGYQQLWPDALVAELEAAGIQRVLDVRLRPQSRRPGMSKTKLALALAEHGIGYERLLPPELVAELEAAGIERVIDVRYRPQSRRPGMSKTKLGLKLAELGISYEHRRELGTPLEIRGLFRAGHMEEAAAAYRAHAGAHAGEELDALAAELDRGPRTALLCLEANPVGCHRRVVAELLAARLPGLVVVDL